MAEQLTDRLEHGGVLVIKDTLAASGSFIFALLLRKTVQDGREVRHCLQAPALPLHCIRCIPSEVAPGAALHARRERFHACSVWSTVSGASLLASADSCLHGNRMLRGHGFGHVRCHLALLSLCGCRDVQAVLVLVEQTFSHYQQVLRKLVSCHLLRPLVPTRP